jgi:hypothetical protein
VTVTTGAATDDASRTVRATRLRAYGAFLLAVAFIAATLDLAFELSSFLRARGFLWTTVQALFVVAGSVFAYLLWFGAGIRSPLTYLRAAPVIVLFGYAMVTTRTSPGERFHFLEYGLVYILALRAVAIDVRGLAAYPCAVALTAIAGWFDEHMQAFSPQRYFDWGDIRMNALAASLAALICFALFGRDPSLARFPHLPPARDD